MERNESFIIHHGGRDYVTSEEMAGIFLRQAERVVATGKPELVVLRHLAGVELALITEESSFSVRPRTNPQPHSAHLHRHHSV